MKKKITALLTVMLMLFLTACGSSKENASYDYAAAGRMMEDAEAPVYEKSAVDFSYGDDYEAEESAISEGDEAPEEVGEGEGAGQKKNSRKLITTVNISSESDDVEAFAKRIEDKVTFLGGYIESSNIYADNDRYGSNSKSADIRARVPADQLETFLKDVEGNSNITSRSTSTEDVTLSYADTEAHERALELEQKSLERMMEMAETVEDIMAIQTQLTDVRYRLDSIRSQLRTYDNDITYSTVYISITETTKFTVTEEETLLDRIKNGFTENLIDVMDAVTEFIVWFITHIPALVLFAVIVLVIILVIKRIASAGKRKKTAPPKKGPAPQMNAKPVNKAENKAENKPENKAENKAENKPENKPENTPAEEGKKEDKADNEK